MSNTDDSAADSGGREGTPGSSATSQLAADLPSKLRVHALARLLGVGSKEVLAALAEVGSPARGPQSSIDRDTAERVVAVLLPDPAEPGGDSAEEIEEGALAAPLVPIFAAPQPLFLAPQATSPQSASTSVPALDEYEVVDEEDTEGIDDLEGTDLEGTDLEGTSERRRRRRGRRGRGRGKGTRNGDAAEGAGDSAADVTDDEAETAEDLIEDDTASTADEGPDAEEDAESSAGERYDEGEDSAATRRRRRRRRRRGGQADVDDEAPREDDPPNTVVHVRETRPARVDVDATGRDAVQAVRGSTRLEAKRQRRRDGREAGRRRPPILSEAEFLARRESVDRVMVVRENGRSGNGPSANGVVQMGVLEDGVLVEHFVTTAGTSSLVGNVYLGRVQNVLPSMEAAFVDIGRGRNAVLYAGEVDWDAAGLEGKARKIEQALSTGDSVLVQVTKDPVGHKGARLTTQISLPGRFLVYVPGGGATGISRKLPDNERKRLKDILRRIVPDDAGVIIRTASEGVTEEAMARDVRRLQAQWEVIKNKAEAPNASAPQLLYEEPDLLIKVVRDLFTEDFSALVVQGGEAMNTIESYVEHVAPDLAPRVRRHVGPGDVFAEFRIDEQLLKALDRKVWLPSGGYLVIDRTEAMTVIDVNTGKFTGSGGNLEETVTRNNLEAAEEIVRQLRLRDIGGIIVIDFIDMVLESNRDLVLRRLTECLGRDRTRHQVAEVTSLGLVQMTRKRVGSGLLEAYSTPCEHCRGRGVLISTEPVVNGNGAHGGDGRAGDFGGGRRYRSRDKPPVQPQPAAAVEPPVQPQPAAPVEPPVQHVTTYEPEPPVPAEPTTEPQADTTPSNAATNEPQVLTPTLVPEQATGERLPVDAAPQDTASATNGRSRHRRAASRPAGPPAGDVSQAQ